MLGECEVGAISTRSAFHVFIHSEGGESYAFCESYTFSGICPSMLHLEYEYTYRLHDRLYVVDTCRLHLD